MGLRENGLIEKSRVNAILGFSDSETVKLDFDDACFSTVKFWALRTMKWFRLRGFLILKSSKNCYHVVFDREVSWTQNMRAVAWVALLSHNRGLARWSLMQCIKGCSTLRVSFKREKPSPRIVFRFGKQEEQVKDFLRTRIQVKNIIKKLRKNAVF
jgi:hypothetical protein